MPLRLWLFLLGWCRLLVRFNSIPDTAGRLVPVLVGVGLGFLVKDHLGLSLCTPTRCFLDLEMEGWKLGLAFSLCVLALFLAGRAWEQAGRKKLTVGKLYFHPDASHPAFKMPVINCGLGDPCPDVQVVEVIDDLQRHHLPVPFELARGGVPPDKNPPIRRGIPGTVDLVYPDRGGFRFAARYDPPGNTLVSPYGKLYFKVAISFEDCRSPEMAWFCVKKKEPSAYDQLASRLGTPIEWDVSSRIPPWEISRWSAVRTALKSRRSSAP